MLGKIFSILPFELRTGFLLLSLAAIVASSSSAPASKDAGEPAPKANPDDMLDKIDEEIKDGKGSLQEVTDETLESFDSVLSGVPGSGPLYQYKLGPELDGFDLSVLRSTARLESHRYDLGELLATTALPTPMHARLVCVLEFGNESGLAEIERSHDIYTAMITDLIGRMSDTELRTTAGKLKLKESVIRESNRRLKTARLREIYLTYFTITPIKTLNNL